jgi:ABC transporter substrate binding protein
VIPDTHPPNFDRSPAAISGRIGEARGRVSVLLLILALVVLAAPLVAGSDPVASGFAKSLARPGGNVTGVTTIDVELVGKQLEILRDALPKLSRVAVPYNPATTRDLLKKALAAGGSLGLEVRAVEALTPDSLPAAFESIGRDRAEAVLVLNDRMLFDARARIAELAAKRSVPLMGENPFSRRGRADRVRGQQTRQLPARRHLRRFCPQGRQARRPPHRATHEVRAGD